MPMATQSQYSYSQYQYAVMKCAKASVEGHAADIL